LVQMPMPHSMASLVRKEGSASRRSRKPAGKATKVDAKVCCVLLLCAPLVVA
jgi:hypothetical protein